MQKNVWCFSVHPQYVESLGVVTVCFQKAVEEGGGGCEVVVVACMYKIRALSLRLNARGIERLLDSSALIHSSNLIFLLQE